MVCTALVALLTTGALRIASAQEFPPLDTNFTGTTVVLPQSPLHYDVLFREGESMVRLTNGGSALARGNHDFIGFIPIDGAVDHGYLIVNHELRDSNSVFGDGGGMTVFEARRDATGHWSAVGPYREVDFSGVRGTWSNCSGANLGDGRVMSAEEYPPSSNARLFDGGRYIRDTSDVTVDFDGSEYTIPAYQNMGWMVEVDVAGARAVRKLYKLGRFSHEAGLIANGGRTVYLTDDNMPAVFFKFEATTPGDFTEGQLYAYRQSDDGTGGSWLAIPMDLQSLIHARDVALSMGATLFVRLEGITQVDGTVFISETGLDEFTLDGAMAGGSRPARHLLEHVLYRRKKGAAGSPDTLSFRDYYGRVLAFDPTTNAIRVFINGGNGGHQAGLNFSNPDGLAVGSIDGRARLAINEDINGRSMGRVSYDANINGRSICEIYLLDPTLDHPNVDDLTRILIGPTGAETTGGVFTPDGSTYFVDIQHPSAKNPPPFNRSATIAITGLGSIARYDDPGFDRANTAFQIHPNPVTRSLMFNRITDVSIYDVRGNRVLVARGARSIDVSELAAGVYYLQTIDGDVKKFIVQ